jgi:hypothetical protein
MASEVKVPDWLLERMSAGELPPERADAVLARLRRDGQEHRLAAIARSNAEILAALPPSDVAREIHHRLAKTSAADRRPRRAWWAIPVAAACAASIAAVAVVRHKTPDDEYVGIKGGDLKPALRIYRKTQAGPELLSANAKVGKGDVLQIRYRAAGQRFGVIASIDGRGTVTFHLPESPGRAAILTRDGEHALAHAYELDDSPDFERFLFVTSDVPFGTEDVARSLRGGSRPPPPLASFEFSVRKSP